MILIQQDDVSMNQVAPTTPVAPTASAASTASSATQTTQPAPSGSSMASDQTAEIDRLLAELDKLSKELEEDKKTQENQAPTANSVVSAPKAPVIPTAPVSPSAPAVESASQESMQTLAQTPQGDVASKSTEEKFDFDAFLADLEKKIDEEAAKNKSNSVGQDVDQSVGQTSVSQAPEETDKEDASDAPDFRQNRQPATLASDSDVQNEVKDESEDLKSQNIFDMLGLATISDEEKNQFLDELEMMIWDDFIIHDLELLLTSEEYGQARQILDDQSKTEDERKEALVVFLEKLIPDLDEVLYEKALELKSEMMAERLAKMKEGTSEEVLAKVKQAEEMISQNKWRSASTLLNQL